MTPSKITMLVMALDNACTRWHIASRRRTGRNQIRSMLATVTNGMLPDAITTKRRFNDRSSHPGEVTNHYSRLGRVEINRNRSGYRFLEEVYIPLVRLNGCGSHERRRY